MATQARKAAEPAERGAVMPVKEVIEIVREWVELYARHLPDFAGAYLWGGITALPLDAPFPLYRDVDVVVVLPKGVQDDTVEVSYRGLILEVIRLDLADHEDAEAVLANPSQGPNIVATQILSDPLGVLEPLQRAVVAEFGRRRWVQARCDEEKAAAERSLADMRGATTPVDRINSVRSFLSALSGLLAVAQLKRPTTRRTLTLLRELLEEQGRPDLHETALTLMGSADMSPAEVEAALEQCLIAYDRAVQVYQTPTPYSFAICDHVRPYYVEGTEEMIDEGNHREAMFWVTCLDEAYLVLRNDAPDAEKPVFAAQLQDMLGALGYTSAKVWSERVNTAECLAQEVYRIANTLVARYPEH